MYLRRRHWQPTPVFLPGKSHGWRILVGYSPWGLKESYTPERLHFNVFKPETQVPGSKVILMDFDCLYLDNS